MSQIANQKERRTVVKNGMRPAHPAERLFEAYIKSLNQIVIFLDFDGVLHPHPCSMDQLFQSMPLFAEAIRKYPHQLELVISSSWREDTSLEEMRARFPQDLRALIIDITPVFSSMSQNEIESMLPTSWENIDLEGKRQREIELWLRTNRPEGTPWIAIDDVASGFASDCQNLLLIRGRVGIQPGNISTMHAMIRTRLEEL